jgi:CRP-like cAMP-binding protein
MRQVGGFMEPISKEEKDLSLFSKVFLFDRVDDKIVKNCFYDDACRCFHYGCGELIHDPKGVVLVLSGEWKAFRRIGRNTKLFLKRFQSGDLFGVGSAFRTEEAPSDLYADKPGHLLQIRRDCLQRLFCAEPKSAENYIVYLSDRVTHLTGRLADCSSRTGEGRLSAWLLSLYIRAGRTSPVQLPCSLTELSEMLNISRATLYRYLDVLEENKIIHRIGRTIYFLEAEKLLEFSPASELN